MHKDDRKKTMQKNKRIREWMRGPNWKKANGMLRADDGKQERKDE